MEIKSKDIRLVLIKELHENPKNRNQHTKEQIDRLCEIINYQGFRNPLIVSKRTGFIVAGHCRLKAARKLKIKELPVLYQDFDNEDQEYAAGISDNAIASWADLEFGAINDDIADLGPDFDINMLGIENFEIEPADKFKTDQDAIPEVKKSICKAGDLWILGSHRLLCGDSTKKSDVDRLMNGERADMVFTDPPYGVGYDKKRKSIANQSKNNKHMTIQSDDLKLDDLKIIISSVFVNIESVLAESSCYYVCSPQGGELGLMMMMMMMNEANLLVRHMIVWVKNAAVFSMNRLDYDYRHEPILFGWSKNRKHLKSQKKGAFNNSVWECKREVNILHPTMKPVELSENAILNSSLKKQNIFDPFSGSGSTLIACEKTNRKCLGLEIDPHYCDVIIKRWEDFTGQKATLAKQS